MGGEYGMNPWEAQAGERIGELERELAVWRAKQPHLDELADILGVCEGVCPLVSAIARIVLLQTTDRNQIMMIVAKNERIEALERDLAAARERIAALEVKCAEQAILVSGLSGKLARAQEENARLRRALDAAERPIPDNWRPGCGHGRFFRVGRSDQVYCTDCLDFRPGPALDAAGLVLGSDPTAPREAVEESDIA